MLSIKIKQTTKLKSYGKCNLLRKRLCEEEISSTQQKVNSKDYVNEIFAGLSWLG